MQGRLIETSKRGVLLIHDEGQNIFVDYKIDYLFSLCQFSCSKSLFLSYRHFFDKHFGFFAYEFDVEF